ncbi:MAG: sodium:proton antiporter [Firmicutes bacterium]|nr:sodium:proton antiporter [Bacillota bacterium]
MFADPRLAWLSRSILIGDVALIAVLLLFCIIRSIKGPRIADRILSINMSGTMIITAIVFVSGILKDTSLIDIGLLYAMISFLAVVVFSRIYRGEYLSLKDDERQEIEAQELQATEEGLHGNGDD